MEWEFDWRNIILYWGDRGMVVIWRNGGVLNIILVSVCQSFYCMNAGNSCGFWQESYVCVHTTQLNHFHYLGQDFIGVAISDWGLVLQLSHISYLSSPQKLQLWQNLPQLGMLHHHNILHASFESHHFCPRLVFTKFEFKISY